jgi:hypothetical protein
MRIAVALILLVHGIAHVVGFLGAWRLAESVPYRTTLFGGRVDVGDVGIRIAGVFWLLIALAFAVAGVVAWARVPWWTSYAITLLPISLAMCVAGWPEAKLGIVVNGALIAILVVGSRAGWFAAGNG